MANNDKDCYDLMNEAHAVLARLQSYSTRPRINEEGLGEIRSEIEEYVAQVKGGGSLGNDYFKYNWKSLIAEALDHMLSDRLSGMQSNNNSGYGDFGINLAICTENDVKIVKAFQELTDIMKKLVETCKPENETRITASRAAKGLPNVATRTARNVAARNTAARNAAARNQAARNQAARNQAEQKVRAKVTASALANVEAAREAERVAEVRRPMASYNGKDCDTLMKDAHAVLARLQLYSRRPRINEEGLGEIRSEIEAYVAQVKAGGSLGNDYFKYNWKSLIAEALDHMLSDRLSGMQSNNNSGYGAFHIDFARCTVNDIKIVKAFEELTTIMKKLVETCEPKAGGRGGKGTRGRLNKQMQRTRKMRNNRH